MSFGGQLGGDTQEMPVIALQCSNRIVKCRILEKCLLLKLGFLTISKLQTPSIGIIHLGLHQLRLLIGQIRYSLFDCGLCCQSIVFSIILLYDASCAAFDEVLDFEVCKVIPVFEATQNVVQAHYTELLIINELGAGPVSSLTPTFFTVIAIFGIMVNQRKVVAHCYFMNLIVTSRYHADMFKALFLKIFNEESEDALVICPNVQQVLVATPTLVCLKFIHDFLSNRVQTHQTYVIDIFAALEFFGSALQKIFCALLRALKLQTIGEDGFFLQGFPPAVH